ncbi:hypothetical protein RclHR1_07670002 [Rhizophagus clarus]|uniref:Uncharacterized protein n=1 Tax=Rhizophagus clarus TaxID=94130 RepID=A0A2Z6SLG9_9GLOM|nr:hypothetical protein RclHR1_07670002 [Rhizophagus clarus]
MAPSQQPHVIENHGKIDIHLNKNDQLPNVKFINHGEVNVYINSCRACKKTIDNPTATNYCSKSCYFTERLLPASKINKGQCDDDVPSTIAITFLKVTVIIIILDIIYYVLTTIISFILNSIFFIFIAICYGLYGILYFTLYCLSVMFYLSIIFCLFKQGLSYLELNR